MKKIYKYNLDYYYGEISGIFVADDKRIDSLIGNTLSFGEVLGKHSEVCDPLDENDLSVVTDNQEAIALFEKYNLETGYNPLNYLRGGCPCLKACCQWADVARNEEGELQCKECDEICDC